jgi:hypothetical protein
MRKYIERTEEATKKHALVLDWGDSAFAVPHCLRLEVGGKFVERPDKRLNRAWELLWRLGIVNKHCTHTDGSNTSYAAVKEPLLLCQMRAVVQTTSRLFSWWFTMVRTLRLMTVNGGVSFGALGSVSGKGFISLGSVTVTSSLHQEN